MNHPYSSLLPTDHSSTCSRESPRVLDSSYAIYPSHSSFYPEYSTSKLEGYDYNYGPTTTHNILSNPSNANPSTIETFIPTSVNFAHLNSNTIPITHHHEHLYPQLSSSPTCNDSSIWLGTSGDYQSLNSTGNTSSYGHYSSPSCSFYPTNHFYDPSQSQWTPSANVPIKFESPHSSSSSCFELSDGQERLTKFEPSNSISPIARFQPPPPSTSTSSQFISIPPKNPLNGNQLTFNQNANEENISKGHLIETRASTLVLYFNMI